MDNQQEKQLLQVSFMLSEYGKDLDQLSKDLKELNSQVNIGDRSLVVRVRLTEDEIKKLAVAIRASDEYTNSIELEKLKKQTALGTQKWVLAGIIITAILSNITDIVSFLKLIFSR